MKKKIVKIAKIIKEQGIVLTEKELFQALKKAALSYDRTPSEGLHPERYYKIIEELK